MFRTAGYYRGVNCPYFASGLCERPHCHFRHVKQDQNEDLNSRPKTPTPSKDASSYLEKLSDGQFPLTSESIKSYSKDNDVDVDEEKSNNHQILNKYTGEPIINEKSECYELGPNINEVNKYTGKPVEYNKYTGEPIYHKEDSSSSSLNKRWTEAVLGSDTPTYNPTPLSELQKRNANPNLNKYSLLASTISSSQEYDPESNYSTSTKVHHVSVPQVGRPSYSSKRSCSYDPANVKYKKPVLKRQRVASFFDAKFSSDEEEENKNVEKDGKDEKTVSSDKEDKFHLKDVNYFEKLLDGPKDVDEKKSRVKVESDDSLDSLDEDVDVTPLLEKCRRRSQSGGNEQDSTEEKTDVKSKVSNVDTGDSSSLHSKTETVSKKGKESSDLTDKKTKKKSTAESVPSTGDKNDKSTEICDRNDKKNHIASSSHSKSSHHGSNKSQKETSSSKISQGNGISTHKSTKESSKNSQPGTSNSSHKSSKESSSKSSHHHKTEYSKSSHNSDKSSHHSSSKKPHSSTSLCKVKDKSKSRDSQDSKSSETENHLVCDTDKSNDLSKSSSSSSSSNNHRKHSRHSNSESSSSSSDKHQHNSERGHDTNSVHTSSHSSGSSKGSKDMKNRAKQKDDKTSKNDKKRTKSVSSERRKSSETIKKKIVDINIDLFGANSEDEEDDEDLVEVPMASDGHISESDMVAFLNDSDYSDEDIDRYDECLRIFQENKGVKNNTNKKKSSPEKSHDAQNPSAPSGKQRMAHKKESEIMRKLKVFEKPKSKMSPAEVMHNRFLQIQEKARNAAAAAATSNNGTASSSTAKTFMLSGSKKRTAHNLSTSKSNGTSTDKAVISTASRTEKRKARTPHVSNLARPTIPSEFGGKVPMNVRQRYLNLIIDDCLKIYDTDKEAFDRGQQEESAVYKRASSKTVYLNIAVNTIKRLRSEQAGPSNSKKPKQTVFTLSHEQILGGKNATKTTFTINRSGGGSKIQEENFKGADLYKRLSRYILVEEQMKENGFPRPSPTEPGSAVFFVEPRKKINVQSSKPTNYEKLCIRCGKMFTVYPNGTYAKTEECTFHWGKAWKKRVAGMIDTRYTCCQGDLTTDGCQIAKGHVHETNKWETMSGYMKTFPCSPPCDGDYGVFAMDCEMVYTKFGIELARVTVTDPENDCVYETLVKPDAAVVDYNTRFSGLTEEILKDVTTTLRDVQAVLLSLFSDRTIVMGHSLESDFSAVRLLHNTVVDTSVVFPHKMGPPYKRALKTLMAEYLKKIIQDDVGGHDSKEDSTSCMELMHLKIKEDARKEPRRS
ncbi:RNA exonuclease 1 homolog [Mizuhopecten yessoensis]|uniref:RNA exonuclease 1-like n=1 Tax=Mizuhopecten yessoensis TaxID=6573 RepID=A0A210QF48_MIZYE|nr:RNA exonuclease 1 homolog [Mizuhopecten yessoensis]OWF47383.1 RNA exonuclease 1-like [Mizuhopecten yessoensis]